jgi:hypothetical protein
MKARVEIEAGICGFVTSAAAECEDGQNVAFAVESSCEKIRALAEALAAREAIDAFAEISPAGESALLSAARVAPKGLCPGCAVPVGLFKAMQVAAGLALPADIATRIAKE